jgi:hypothetical protein
LPDPPFGSSVSGVIPDASWAAQYRRSTQPPCQAGDGTAIVPQLVEPERHLPSARIRGLVCRVGASTRSVALDAKYRIATRHIVSLPGGSAGSKSEKRPWIDDPARMEPKLLAGSDVGVVSTCEPSWVNAMSTTRNAAASLPPTKTSQASGVVVRSVTRGSHRSRSSGPGPSLPKLHEVHGCLLRWWSSAEYQSDIRDEPSDLR